MKCLILAGGSGTRLWPWSRSKYPKQFLSVIGGTSFFQRTLKRALLFTKAEEIFVITHADFFHTIAAQAAEIDTKIVDNILLEPAPKNTAPAIAFAMEAMKKRGVKPNETLFVCPADHMIAPEEKFADYVKQADVLAKQGKLVTFGIRPSKPETGYGYIKADGNEVKEFVEKPDLQTAQAYVLSGDYFWNSGMFLFSINTMEKELKKHCPDLSEPISIDYAVMEKSDCVAMLPLDLAWSDVGSWENIYELLDKDENHNVTRGNVMAFDTKNSLILAQKRLVSTIGLDDMLVVETDDVVLVAPKSESQRVKDIVGQLRDLGKEEVDEHLTVNRPWGSFTVLEEEPRFKIKRITVNPLATLSLQMHYHRSEHWVIVSGTAKVTIQDKEKVVHEGESIFVPKSAIHRVENPGKVPLEIIEVQVGEYLGEDDIIRFEDVYGRLKEDESFRILMKK